MYVNQSVNELFKEWNIINNVVQFIVLVQKDLSWVLGNTVLSSVSNVAFAMHNVYASCEL